MKTASCRSFCERWTLILCSDFADFWPHLNKLTHFYYFLKIMMRVSLSVYYAFCNSLFDRDLEETSRLSFRVSRSLASTRGSRKKGKTGRSRRRRRQPQLCTTTPTVRWSRMGVEVLRLQGQVIWNPSQTSSPVFHRGSTPPRPHRRPTSGNFASNYKTR